VPPGGEPVTETPKGPVGCQGTPLKECPFTVLEPRMVDLEFFFPNHPYLRRTGGLRRRVSTGRPCGAGLALESDCGERATAGWQPAGGERAVSFSLPFCLHLPVSFFAYLPVSTYLFLFLPTSLSLPTCFSPFFSHLRRTVTRGRGMASCMGGNQHKETSCMVATGVTTDTRRRVAWWQPGRHPTQGDGLHGGNRGKRHGETGCVVATEA
jgi:hypothetical protein